jgi:hypothetical protein
MAIISNVYAGLFQALNIYLDAWAIPKPVGEATDFTLVHTNL